MQPVDRATADETRKLQRSTPEFLPNLKKSDKIAFNGLRVGVSKLRPGGEMRPIIQLFLAPTKSANAAVYHICLYVLSIFGNIEEISDMICPQHSITATIEGKVIDIKYVGELEIHAVLTYHCATYSVLPGPSLIALYLALTAKTLNTLVLEAVNKVQVAYFWKDILQKFE